MTFKESISMQWAPDVMMEAILEVNSNIDGIEMSKWTNQHYNELIEVMKEVNDITSSLGLPEIEINDFMVISFVQYKANTIIQNRISNEIDSLTK